MNKTIVFFIGFTVILLISFTLPGYFSAADLLQNIPSFSADGFTPPKNSLLADPVFQFEPWRDYAKKRILSGEIPYWNPYNGSGSPFLANPQAAVFFPLNIFYYLFPTQAGLYAFHILKLYLLGFFTYLYLRSLKISSASSILGALVTVSSGFSLAWLQWPHTNVFLFFPLLLFLTEMIAKKNDSIRWYVLIALTYFFAITGGHPETLFHVFLLHMTYLLFRLRTERGKLIGCILAIVWGFLLGSVLILPFLEYLLQSNAFSHRTEENINFYLSPIGFFQFFFPFLSGAPHQPFYRSVHAQTNFQEGIGGYVGASVFITALWGTIVLWKNRYIKYWAIVVLLVILLSYGVWPFTLINTIPPFTMIVNLRLIGFVVFGLITIFSFTLDSVLKRERKSIALYRSQAVKKICIISIVLLPVTYILSLRIETSDVLLQRFLPFLRNHLFFIILTTLIYALLIFVFLKYLSKKKLFFGVSVLLFLQTAYLFWNYNPVISKEMFYPQTKLTQALAGLQRGTILEVGNMNFPENINLMYGLSQVRNNDAIEIASYKSAFDRLFPVKNRWSRVEEPKIEAARMFGIRYIVSDYDIRLKKIKIQEKQGEVLRELPDKQVTSIQFNTKNDTIVAARLLFATFNRNNKCNVSFTLFNKEKTKNYFKKAIPCRDFHNFMFYTISFPNITLEKKQNYILELTLLNSQKNNQVALVGEGKKPFLELLSQETNEKGDKLSLLMRESNMYLWEVTDSQFIAMDGSYALKQFNPERMLFHIDAKSKQNAIVKLPYYPGWQAFVDNKQVPVLEEEPFLQISLPEGEHTLRVEYTPYSFYLGLGISIFSGIGGTLLIYFVKRSYYKRKKTKKKL